MKGLTIGTACSLLESEEVEPGLLGSGRGSRLFGSRRGLAVARLVVLEVGPAEQLVGLPQRVLVERVAEPVEEALLLAPVGGRGPAHERRVAGSGDGHGGHAHRHGHCCT
jgi:hypothetical protein